MKQLLDSDMELFVESEFIYVPLLFDPEIEKELKIFYQEEETQKKSTSPAIKTIIHHNGRYFIKGLEIHSLLENFKDINDYDYERIRNDCLKKYHLLSEFDKVLLDETLHIILFEVLPYFIRKNRSVHRNKLDRDEIFDLIIEKTDIPEKYHQDAKAFGDLSALKRIVEDLDAHKPLFKPLENGLMSSHQLRNWLYDAVQANILKDERDRMAKTLQVRQLFSKAKPEHIAAMLYITDTGALEIEGFGFTKNDSHNEYLVYKRTGTYTLKDYYARSYHFPDCRVAISTYAPLWPFVMEKYKHPFLLRYKAGQEICMKDFRPPDELSAKNIIHVLEEGLTALRFGYDARRRNGYHSLDKTWVHIPTIDFEDYRNA